MIGLAAPAPRRGRPRHRIVVARPAAGCGPGARAGRRSSGGDLDRPIEVGERLRRSPLASANTRARCRSGRRPRDRSRSPCRTPPGLVAAVRPSCRPCRGPRGARRRRAPPRWPPRRSARGPSRTRPLEQVEQAAGPPDVGIARGEFHRLVVVAARCVSASSSTAASTTWAWARLQLVVAAEFDRLRRPPPRPVRDCRRAAPRAGRSSGARCRSRDRGPRPR